MPVDRRKLGQAFLTQAKDDLRSAAVLGTGNPHAMCVMLQMGMEKLAKAWRCLYEPGVNWAKLQGSHKGAALVVLQVRNGGLVKLPPTLQIEAGKQLKFVQELENHQPANAKAYSAAQGQLEYPWIDTSGRVRCPATELPLLRQVRNPFGQTYRPERLARFGLDIAQEIEKML